SGLGQVSVKVAAAGVNPKDRKMFDLWGMSMNSGDDIAGIVHAVGPDVVDFRPGDRVAGFYKPCTPNGSFAEYAMIETNTASQSLGLPLAAISEIPLNACTAATGLYLEFRLPAPWLPAKEFTPLIIWGATSTLAVKSNIHRIIWIAGSPKQYLEDFIDRSQGDTILDYRDSEDDIKEGVQNAAGGRTILHAIEKVSSERSAHIMAETMGTGGHIALVLFEKEYTDIPSHVKHNKHKASVMHEGEKDFGLVISRFVGRDLQEGWFKPQRHEVVPGGLNGVITAFERLKSGEAHAMKQIL
ncbi:hypothetical protein GGP41_007214, partial [Bipolaris sorokiniana]